ncbi:MAG: CobW family GTP-binding protein [Arenicella sp.]
MRKKLENIPTNIITGFLGVGKTTAILHLLTQKPENERWAVLVNEFGEIGIDGSLYAGLNHADPDAEQTLFIREVPGGCMCCAAGLPLQIALTLLLNDAKPDRLFIEPTGLGHPKEVIQTLSEGHYLEVLDLQHTITLVDARKVSDDRYRTHATFIQQLEVADVIVANKTDQYGENDSEKLQKYLHELGVDKPQRFYETSMGRIDLSWLSGAHGGVGALMAGHVHGHSHALDTVPDSLPMPGDKDFPECGYLTVKNKGEGFFSQGWVFQSRFVFDNDKLNRFFQGIEVERLKGVFVTPQGSVSYNKADGVLTEMPISDSKVSRIEWIHHDENRLIELEQALMKCMQT